MSDFPRDEALFLEALDIPATEREAFLRAACGPDAAIRQRVAALLYEHERAKGALDAPPPGIPANFDRMLRDYAPVDECAGSSTAQYKLLHKIGEGGCGVVFMAQQTAPVHRQVALKVIKLGMDTREVIARFEAERQALALMDHPNIARVLDAGMTEAGRPFFVMELVRGIPITQHCDDNNLGTAARLKLFVQVCRAVRHAHHKGIIHRDLKPSNILVTMQDDVTVPKIIDFGIAKAMHGRLTDKTLFTAFEQFVGTPAYMSPEQTVVSGLDVDTRSDIYSLGVLLYELLTGSTPFGMQELTRAGIDEVRRIIREAEPPRPSARVDSLDAAVRARVARQRGVDAPALRSTIRGDVDWIVMRCLEKDPARRYDTADGLANDIEHHLRNEPVMARPPSTAYVLTKLVRRNKVAFSVAAGIVGALMVGLVFATWSLQRERAARQRADREAARSAEVARLMKRMLAGVRQENARGSDTSLLRAIVDETEEQLGRELKGQPEVEADLRETLGQVYLDIGQFASAALMHETALNLRRQVFGPAHFKVGDSLHFLGDALARQRKYAEAETALRAAIALRNNLPGSKPASVDESRAVLNRVLRNAGRVQETPPTGKPAAMPEAIRILAAITRPTGEPANLGDIVTMARTQGVLEGEFSPDGVEIAWLAVGDNAAVLRQRGADFHVGGGRGFGAFVNRILGADVPIKVLLRIPRTGDAGIHLAVRADSPFQTLADLKGHRLACTRGGGYLKMALLLEKHGFSMKDFEMVLVDSALVLRKALLAGDADSIIMLRPIVELGAPEAVRLILSSGPDAVVISGGALCVRADFEQRHPAAVQRVVTALVKLAAWHSEAKNRDAIFELWARSGLSRAEMEQHWAATPLKERYSPLMDEHYFAIMRREVEDEKRFGFLPADATVNIESLAEPKYLRHALAELNLEGYWPEFDQQGQPKAAR